MRRYVYGFPGVGKSSLAGIDGPKIVDADAAAFQFRGGGMDELHGEHEGLDVWEPDPAFPGNYLDYIRDVDADLVLVNCHLGLLPDLEEVLVVYPDRRLKEEYLERYRDRGDNPSFVSYMDEEFEGMVGYLDSFPVSKIKITEKNIYLQDVLQKISQNEELLFGDEGLLGHSLDKRLSDAVQRSDVAKSSSGFCGPKREEQLPIVT